MIKEFQIRRNHIQQQQKRNMVSYEAVLASQRLPQPKKTSAYLILISYLVDPSNPKIWIRLKSNKLFLRAEQDLPEKCCVIGCIGGAI